MTASQAKSMIAALACGDGGGRRARQLRLLGQASEVGGGKSATATAMSMKTLWSESYIEPFAVHISSAVNPAANLSRAAPGLS